MASEPSLERLIKDVSQDKLNSRCKEADLKRLALSTTKWRLLAPFLGFNESEEREIMNDYPGNVKRQKIALYIRWREKALRNATYRTLIEKLHTIRRNDLVEKVVELLTQPSSHDICEDDDQYTIDLRRLYQTQKPKQTFQWPPVPNCKYVSLVLMQEEKPNSDDEDLHRADIQQILQKRKHLQVTLDNIMMSDQSYRKLVLIEGAPGVGKSTFALHVCQQWAEGLLFDSYTYIILVQLHHPTVQEAKCLADILPHCTKGRTAKALADKIISEDGENTLFIIDGWDEFPLRYQKESFIHKFLFEPHNVGVNMSTILIASRTNASANLHRIATSRVKILGFHPEGIEDYFLEIFKKDKDKAERLLAHFRLHPSLHGICYIPLNAAIVAHIYSYDVLPLTLHSIFCVLILNCIIHETSKQTRRKVIISSLSDLPQDLKHQLNQIAFLAYEGTFQNKVMFNEKELKQLHSPATLPTLGLLQEVEYCANYHRAKRYIFMHSSVQELLAAFHLSQQEPGLQAGVFAESLSFPITSFPSFVQHFAGFTKLEGSEIRECVLQVVRTYKEACSGVHRHTLSRMKTLPFLSLLKCLYEAQNETIYELVASHLEEHINLACVSLDLYEFLSLGRLLHSFRTEKTVLFDHSHACVPDEGLYYLFKEFKGKTCNLKLYLESNKLSAKGAERSIAPLLRTNKVVHLNLSWNSISNEGAAHIARMLVPNTSLLFLALNHCAVGDEGIREISNAISNNHTLQELCLSGNPFTNDGLMFLSAALTQNKGLSKLRIDPDFDVQMLKCNPSVTGEGFKLFVGGMAENEHITELDIGKFGAEDEGVKETLKVTNEDRKKRNIQVLTLFCT